MSSASGGSGSNMQKRKLWEESPNTFTEFGPLSSDMRPSGGFFSRLWKRNKDDNSQSNTSSTSTLNEDPVLDDGLSLSSDRVDGKAETPPPSLRPSRKNSRASNLADADSISTVSAPGKLDQSEEVLESQVIERRVQHRTLSSVLSRLGSIIDQRSTTPQMYKDSDFKQYWMPDSSCRECYDCGDKFTMFLRRHHCRICGQIFCSKCCNQELPGKIIGYKGGIRVCTYCCKVVQRYAQQSASTGDYKALEDLKAISQLYSESSGRSLSPRLPSGMEDMIPPHRGESMPDLPGSVAADMNTPFDLTPQSEFSSQESLLLESKLLIQDSVQLRELWRLMSDAEAGVETQTLRIRLRTHQNCIVGKELVDWLIKYDKAATRDQAMAIGQALIYAGYLEPFSNQLPVFKDDFTLYRHGETASSFEMKGEPDSMPTISEELEKNEPLWFQEIGKSNSQDTGQQESSSLPEDQLSTLDSEGQKSISSESDNRTIFYISEGSQSGSFSEVPKIAPMKEMIEEPLPKGDYSVHGLGDDFLKGALFLGKPPMTSSDVVVSSHGWRSVEQLREENGERLAYERLKKAHTELWHILIRQMLSQHSLLLSWESVILTCITQVSHFVRPDVRLEGDEMDIRNYVHIKKVPGGNKNDTSMFHGVIFTKNIAHKKMKTKIVNPLILLMKGTIEFQRVENKFSSLEPQILQEREFMRNCVMKMIAYRPNVVVVEKSVSRLAQEYLLEAGITLLYNVKQSVMERLARFTQADIVSSIDGLVRKPKMGFCHDFRVQTYNLPNKESKTLAIFDGCATHLGCTIVLSGGTLGELRRVKHILKFMNYTAYNSLLELCYCMDEFALPHPGADEIGQPFEGLENSMELGHQENSYGLRNEESDSKSQDDKDECNDPVKFQMDVDSDSEYESVEPTATYDRTLNLNKFDAVDNSGNLNNENFQAMQDNEEAMSTDRSGQWLSGSVEEALLEDKGQMMPALRTRRNTDSELLRQEELSKDSGDYTQAKLTAEIMNAELNLPDEDHFGEDDTNDSSTTAGSVTAALSSLIESTLPGYLSNSSNEKKDKVRHSSGVSNASTSYVSEGMSGRSTPDCAFKTGGPDDVLWDSSPKLIANIVCIIPRSAVPARGEPVLARVDPIQTNNDDNPSDPTCGRKLKKLRSASDVLLRGDPRLKEHEGLTSAHIDMSKTGSSPGLLSSCEVEGGHDDKEMDCPKDPSAVANTFVKKKSERCVSDGIPSRATTSKLTELTDFSDPLLGYQNTQDESIFHSTNTQKIALREIKQTKYKRFRKALDGVHLSVSPYHKYSVPFMETDKGSRCAVRRYLPEEIFWSNLFDGEAGQMLSKSSKFLDSDSSSKMTNKSNIQVLEPHALITCKLTEPIRENESQKILADFRARGGRIRVMNGVSGRQSQFDAAPKKVEDSINDFTGTLWEKKIDCLEPLNHQRLMVLFSSYSYKSANHPYPCVYPWVVTMEFYGRNDITLGGFLERFCFKKQYACPSPTCDTPMTDHVRRFVHGNACINLLLKKLDNEVPGGKENILMWSWCRKCKQVTPVVPISNDTWSISFAKYLDLRLHSSSFLRRGSAEPCSHSLHHDHFQYFGHRNIVASFKFNTISLKELALPPCVVTLQPPTFDAAALGDMVRNITYRATNSYSVMLENTMKLKQEFTSEAQVRTISEFLVEQQFDKKCFRDAATNIQMKIQELIHSVTTAAVSGPSDCDMSFHLYSIFDNIELLKRTICEDVLKWNTRMQDFMANQQKKSRPQASKKERDSGNLVDDLEKSLKSAADRSSNKISAPPIPATSTPQPQTGGATITLPTFPASPPSMSSLSSTDDSSIVTSGEYSSKVQSATAAGKPAKIILPATAASPEVQVTEASTASLQSLPGPTTAEGQGSNVGPSPAAAVPPAGVSNPSSATEDDSTDGWFQDLKGVTRRWLSTSSFVPLSLPFDYSEHHTLPLCERVPIVVYDNEPSSIIAYALSSSDYLCRLREIHTATRRTNSDPNVTGAYTNKTTGPLGSGGEGVAETGRRSGGGMLSFLRGSSREPSPHHTSPHAPRHVMEAVRYVPGSDWGESGGHPDDVDISILSDEATPSPEEKPKVGSALPSPHIELQFSDATAKFYCRVYFAEQFRKLRKLLFLGNDNLFIRSLGRCKSWEAKGGKSGSSFCKTDDDRFILKQMSNMEVESFEKFGPQYFQYIRMCITEQQPTALAKILGVYRIGFRNTQTNNALRQDVLVMENLFYNRNISQKFDLKGSMRNRLVNTSSKRGEEELVLLDENLLKCSVESPLYLRPHSKYVLKSAITSDSTFLSTNLVMDYSLLVGVDEDTQEMVVGIIDYIRTFTWDKKLEMVVKSSGILGGQGKMPTVVSPQLYRGRFLEAMDRYFLHVPDHWTGLGRDSPSRFTRVEMSEPKDAKK